MRALNLLLCLAAVAAAAAPGPASGQQAAGGPYLQAIELNSRRELRHGGALEPRTPASEQDSGEVVQSLSLSPPPAPDACGQRAASYDVYLLALELQDAVPAGGQLEMACTSSSGERYQPVLLVAPAGVPLGTPIPLSRAQFLGELLCGEALSCMLYSDGESAVAVWRPVVFSALNTEAVQCSAGELRRDGRYEVRYDACEHVGGRPAYSSDSRGYYSKTMTIVSSVVCSVVFVMVSATILVRHVRARRRGRGSGDVELQGRGPAGSRRPDFKPPPLFVVNSAASSSPPAAGYAGPVVVWSFDGSGGDVRESLRQGSLAVAKQELSLSSQPQDGEGGPAPAAAPRPRSLRSMLPRVASSQALRNPGDVPTAGSSPPASE